MNVHAAERQALYELLHGTGVTLHTVARIKKLESTGMDPDGNEEFEASWGWRVTWERDAKMYYATHEGFEFKPNQIASSIRGAIKRGL